MPEVFTKHVFVCTQEKPDGVPSCAAVGGEALLKSLRAQVGRAGLADRVLITGCGCLGLCERGPNAIVYPDGIWYTKVGERDVELIVSEHLALGRPVVDRDDPELAKILEEVAEHRAKVAAMTAARERAGVLPDELNTMLRAFQPSRVVLTAMELDVFSAIGSGSTAADVASAIGADPRATETLLNALVALGLLARSGDRFANGQWAETYLRAGAPHDSRAALMHTVHLWSRWSTLTECVKAGTSVSFQEMGERSRGWTEAFIAAMDKNAVFRAPQVVSALDLAGVKRVLDLGGGSGAYAIAFARANPAAEVTVFDLPSVTPLAKRYAGKSEVGDRIRTVDGDLRSDPYGRDFDLVFISAICHMNGPAENVDMLRRAGAALRPGGQVAIQDFILNDDRTGPRSAALFALNMLVGTRRGSAYNGKDYLGWLAEAGFADGRLIDLPGPTGLVVARKPE